MTLMEQADAKCQEWLDAIERGDGIDVINNLKKEWNALSSSVPKVERIKSSISFFKDILRENPDVLDQKVLDTLLIKLEQELRENNDKEPSQS